MQNTDAKIKVAVVNHFTAIREAFTVIINGFKDCDVVFGTANGCDLLVGLAEMKSLPDVCVMEISETAKEAFKTAQLVRELYPAIKILILSSHDFKYIIYKMIQADIHGYLSYKCDSKDLHEALTSLYNLGYYYSETAPENLFRKVKAMPQIPELTKSEFDYLSLLHYSRDIIYVISSLKATVPEMVEYFFRVKEKLTGICDFEAEYKSILSEKNGLSCYS